MTYWSRFILGNIGLLPESSSVSKIKITHACLVANMTYTQNLIYRATESKRGE